MWIYPTTTAAALLIAVCAVRWARAWGQRRGIQDAPDARRVHDGMVPRTGGLGIVTAFLPVAAIALWLRADTPDTRWLGVLTGMVMAYIVGLLDDVRGVNPKLKLFGLGFAALAVCGAGARIDALVLPGLDPLALGPLAWPVTMIWLIGMAVAMNFLDGLDGLAGGAALIATTTLGVCAALQGLTDAPLVTSALAGAIVGFLLYNRHPASIFMGDGGAMFLGFAVAALAVVTSRAAGSSEALIGTALVMGLPILDTASTMLRRGMLQRRSLFAAERGHLHHRLLDLGLSHRKTVRVILLVIACCAGVALAQLWLSGPIQTLGLIGLTGGGLVVLFVTIGSLPINELGRSLRGMRSRRSRQSQARQVFDDTQLRFTQVETVAQWWDELCRAADSMGIDRLRLPLSGRDGEVRTLTWERENDEATGPSEMLTAWIPVPQRRYRDRLLLCVELSVLDSVEVAAAVVGHMGRVLEENGLTRLKSAAADPQRVITPGVAAAQPAPSPAPHTLPPIQPVPS